MDLGNLRRDLREALSTDLFTISGTEVTLASVTVFLLGVVLSIALALIARRAIERTLRRRSRVDAGVAYALGRAVQYTAITAGVLVSFQFLGIDFTRLGVILGFLSVGIGFGLQNVTSNFVSGLVLLIERPVTIGDRVQIGETEGTIETINIRSTVVRSLANVAIIVPNSELITNNVVNWSHEDPRIRLSIPVGVSYNSDEEVVIATLMEVAAGHPEVLATPEPTVRLNSFGDSSWDMELLVWLRGPDRWRDVRSELNIAIVGAFRAHGVEIPFPQRDLHLRSPLPIPLDRPGVGTEDRSSS